MGPPPSRNDSMCVSSQGEASQPRPTAVTQAAAIAVAEREAIDPHAA